MPFKRITASILVEEKDGDATQESIQSLFDSFVIQHTPVFDSDVSCATVCEVAGADEVRREAQLEEPQLASPEP